MTSPTFNIRINQGGQELDVKLTASNDQTGVLFQGKKYTLNVSGTSNESISNLIKDILPAVTDIEELKQKLNDRGISCEVNQIVKVLTKTALRALAPENDSRKREVESNITPVRISDTEAPAPVSIQERMRDYKVPSVSIAVIEEGEVAWAEGYGCDPEVRFQTASIGKPVTALLVLKLAQDKKVDLDTDVNVYLKSWHLPGKPVTLRMLLAHTAGISVGGFPGFKKGDDIPKTTKELLEGKYSRNDDKTTPIHVEGEPGEKWSYSGGGYTILQQIIEDVVNEGKEEKQTFAAIVEEMIFKPLNMDSSTYEPPKNGRLAKGHDNEGKPVEGGYNIYPEQGAAGFWTTPSDLAKFVQEIQKSMHHEGNILTKETVSTMLTPIIIHNKENAGLGLGAMHQDGDIRFSHGGHNEGYQTIMIGFTESGKGAIVFSNGENGSNLNREIMVSIAKTYGFPFEDKLEEIKTYKIDHVKLPAYEGTFLVEGTDPQQTIQILVKEDGLYSKNPVLPFTSKLHNIGKDKFMILENGEEYTFVADNEGHFTSIVSNEADQDQKITKMIK